MLMKQMNTQKAWLNPTHLSNYQVMENALM